MVACQILKTGELWQDAILARGVVETFSIASFFYGKYTFQIICQIIARPYLFF